MRQADARELAATLHAVVDTMEKRASKQGLRKDETNDCRGLGIRLVGSPSNSDRVDRDRRMLRRADAEAEARRRKKLEAIAHEGPDMLKSSSHDERRNTDCAHYAGCLDRFVARYCQRGEAHAHCPEPCAYYQREDLRRDPRVASSLCIETRIIT